MFKLIKEIIIIKYEYKYEINSFGRHTYRAIKKA